MRCLHDVLFWVRLGVWIAAAVFALFGAVGLVVTYLDPFPTAYEPHWGMTMQQTNEYIQSGRLWRFNVKLYGMMMVAPIWLAVVATVATFAWKRWRQDATAA
jgi:hypothetical protein